MRLPGPTVCTAPVWPRQPAAPILQLPHCQRLTLLPHPVCSTSLLVTAGTHTPGWGGVFCFLVPSTGPISTLGLSGADGGAGGASETRHLLSLSTPLLPPSQEPGALCAQVGSSLQPDSTLQPPPPFPHMYPREPEIPKTLCLGLRAQAELGACRPHPGSLVPHVDL